MLTQRGNSKLCVRLCAGSHFRIYIKLLDCVNWKKKIGQFYQTWGKKCWERADGRQDFHVGEFLLAGPVWVVVPICPDAPIHFLGPLWCQKMNGLCIWSLVINSWIRSIAWTDMNQGERRGGKKRDVFSAVCHMQTAPLSFIIACESFLGFFSPPSPPPQTFQLIYFWLENTHLPLPWWHAFARLMRSESAALQSEKVCLISVTEELGDVFISL